ncbi:MAG: hypothetical protein ACK4WC_05255 [Rubrimonas sp.]
MYRFAVTFAAAALFAVSAQAATITTVNYMGNAAGLAGVRSHIDAYRAAEMARGVVEIRTEGFEGFAAWPHGVTANPLTTNVGVIAGLGGKGSGSSAVNGGDAPMVRTGNVAGRQNITAGGTRFLDSNDTLGFSWTVDFGGLSFDRISFVLTDVADQGATMTLSGGGFFQDYSFTRQANGAINFVDILLDAPLTSLTLTFLNNRVNDGFGIDELSVSLTGDAPAPVPVPAAGLLLASGLGLLALNRRRARRA